MTRGWAPVSDSARHAATAQFDRPSDLTQADVARLAKEIFGVTVSRVQRLPSERDRNFSLADAGGDEFVLKVTKEDQRVLDLQTQALLHIRKNDPALPIPRVVPPVTERPEAVSQILGDENCRVRCLTYVPGRPLAKTQATPDLWRRVGCVVARLDKALANFRHPAEEHILLWDLKRADRVRGLLENVPDQTKRTEIDRVLQRFSVDIKPRLTPLRAQVVHNDLNPYNVLTIGRRRLIGIVDFGDCIRAPLVQELATAGSYQISMTGHPLESFAQFLSAYHAALTLLPEELAILPDLIIVRLALWITIMSWRALHEPDNARYLLRNEWTVRTNLTSLVQLPAADRTNWLEGRLATLEVEP